MHPILYKPSEKEFLDNGLAVLTDCTKCLVTEERNGAYTLEMQYPANGRHYDLIAEDCILLAKPNPDDEESAARDAPPRVAEAAARESAPEGGTRAVPEVADGPPFAQGVRRVLRIKARAIARIRVRVEAVREVGARVSRVESHARDIAPPRRGRRRETIRKCLIGRADCVVRDFARFFANPRRNFEYAVGALELKNRVGVDLIGADHALESLNNKRLFWIARNVEKVEDVADNGPDPADAVPCVYYTADVAYMRAAVTLEEITADTDAAYKRAAAWAPEAITLPTALERIEALEALGNDILAAMFGGE